MARNWSSLRLSGKLSPPGCETANSTLTERPAERPASGRAAETPASLPAWPGGAEVAVALTFDVDAEAPWLGEGPEYARRLTLLSQARYGPVRGLGRILDMLTEAGL